ncbi:hypothetical protein F2Q69_00008884 [Brassica cretica]|uniref:Uncharacterized protein n=1 Tax=Brassica cretica TaxID=69181 RepID=A0A8S9PDC1_BRACR|nr:hypothetical protein F2Q69_00008884 [Brassica cretica]
MILEPLKVELAVAPYISVFKAERIQTYPDGVELMIFGSSVLVTTVSPRFSSIVELRRNPTTISSVKQNSAFAETNLELNLLDKDFLKFRDPFRAI